MGFIENLDKLRQRLKLNKSEFAESIGISESTVYAWYNRGTLPTFFILQKIIDKYSVEWSEVAQESIDESVEVYDKSTNNYNSNIGLTKDTQNPEYPSFDHSSSSEIFESSKNYDSNPVIVFSKTLSVERFKIINSIVGNLTLLTDENLSMLSIQIEALANSTMKNVESKWKETNRA
jgi:transcriptional regulator with XRE-family HTH domain